jgi:spermidine synthase
MHRRADATVVEIDPGVTRAAREAMGLVDDPRLHVVHEDARTFVDRAARDPRGPRYDVVYGDAFLSYSVPFHLTTVELARSVRACLAPDGAYVLNVIDSFASLRFVGAVRSTLARVFAHVDVLVLAPDVDGETGGARDTFVLVATDRAVDLDGLLGIAAFTGGGPREIEVLRGDRLSALSRASDDLVLTDDYAPVENLLLPVAATR